MINAGGAFPRPAMSRTGGLMARGAALPLWIDLIPAGVFTGRDGRGPYRNDHPEQVVRATRELGMSAGLPIDYDHATDFRAPEGRPAPAAGWITDLRVLKGVIQGRVEWTRSGAKAVATRLYRYISPVFEFSDDGTIRRLLRAAVTNNPNLYLKAISSAAAPKPPVPLDRTETELCRINGIDPARFAKVKRDRMTGRPLILGLR